MIYTDEDFYAEMNFAIVKAVKEKGWWKDQGPQEDHYSLKMVQHNLSACEAIQEGDVDEAQKHLIDVANYAMMLWWSLKILKGEGADEKKV